MPSKSAKQARFMAACSHGAGYDSCPPAKISTEFNQADKGTGIMSKSTGSKAMRYARGGAVIGKTSEFMKTPNEFTEPSHGSGATDEVFGKSGDGQASGNSNPTPKNKAIGHRP